MLLREVASLLVVVSVFGCCAADPKTRKLTSPENIDNKEAISSIAAAAFSGDVAAIEQALAGGESITDQSFGARMTPLAVAASQGHADVVQWLIRRGAPVNIPDQTGTPPAGRAPADGRSCACGRWVVRLRTVGPVQGRVLRTNAPSQPPPSHTDPPRNKPIPPPNKGKPRLMQ